MPFLDSLSSVTGIINSDKELKILGITTELKKSGVLLGKKNFVFRHGTNKELDSRMLDFIHGSSPIFGNTRKIMGISQNNRCYFCEHPRDNAEHQLIHCEEVQDDTHYNFQAAMNGSETHSYLEEILIPKNDSIQRNFIERVEFLWGQHQHLMDLLNYS